MTSETTPNPPATPSAPAVSRSRIFLKESALFLLDILYNAAVIIAIVVFVRTLLISPFRIIGSSMADTLHNSEFILIDKLSYRLGEPHRGDPVVFKPPITDKYPHKFEEAVTADDFGIARLEFAGLSSTKPVNYCQNRLMALFFFCKESVETGDLIFLRAIPQGGLTEVSPSLWRTAVRRTVTAEEERAGFLSMKGEPRQSYLLRIYSANGPEYFVKRIIGIPGDRVRVENGRVYLKTPADTEYREIQEPYLNAENRYQTFLPQQKEAKEFEVPEGHYFLLGDNRNHSNDSRSWFSPITEEPAPFASRESLSGRVLLVLWPFSQVRLIPRNAE